MNSSTEQRSSVERYILKNEIEKLEKKRSFNMSTSLISLYIPPKTRISDIAQQLRDEAGTATNIKDKNTGKAVQAAISSILARMKYIQEVPENGLAIFAGQTSLNNIEYHAIVPPEKINIKLYMCDNVFHVNHLKDMLESKLRYGLIIVSRGGVTLATLQGSRFNLIREMESNVPKKHKMGGQSQRRFQRLVEEAASHWYNKVAEVMNKTFLDDIPVEAIVVGGPAMSKTEFLDSNEIDYRIKDKVIGVYDVGYDGMAGLKELVEKAEDRLGAFELVKERKLMKEFMSHLGKDTGLVTYGENEVKEALEKAAVDKVIVSEEVDRVNMEIECEGCGYQLNDSVQTKRYDDYVNDLSDKKCPECGEARLVIKEERDLIKELNDMAKNTGAEVEVISVAHEDGEMLYSAFGGIAAFLRYKLYGY